MEAAFAGRFDFKPGRLARAVHERMIGVLKMER